jgi:hypothetical protein
MGPTAEGGFVSVFSGHGGKTFSTFQQRLTIAATRMPLMLSRLLPLLAVPLLIGSTGVASTAQTCRFLQPIGGTGSPIVAKSVGAGRIFGKTNWNTDFIVDQPYSSFKFFFTANSSDANATYPVEAFMKFTDGSNLQVVNESMNPPIGRGRMFGPFPAIPGKQASQMNFKVGASNDPGALGFSYRISVQGCN